MQIARLTQLGRLILVQWQDMGKEHPLIGRRYEQRIIYSHAALALAGMRAVMIPMALDEYAVTVAGPYQQLSLGAMVRNCAAGKQGLCYSLQAVAGTHANAVCLRHTCLVCW
jgi:hypothetical protein